jgi:RNA polymerase sigma-70 factor (ECF subfamily)
VATFSRAFDDIEAIYNRQVSTVYRVCYSYLGNRADAEDATQNVFLRLLRSGASFESGEHEKAWLIRVSANLCKDVLKASVRKNVPLDAIPEPEAKPQEYDATLDVVLSLDEKYKDVVYLYYYEGWSTDQISGALGKPPSTIRSYLSEARALLRERLGGEMA